MNNIANFDSTKNSTIMMVDDETIMLDLIEIFLQDAGYSNFISQSDSTKAIDMVLRESPDVLLLDILMPEVDGFEILEALRKNEQTKHLPIVILTSSGDSETKLKALELGATDFLAKPVDNSELVLRIRNILTVKAYQDQINYYDALTGLPNRKFCIKRIDKATKAFSDTDESFALLDLRLIDFKKLSDSYGHKIGDHIIVEVSKRILDCLRVSDYVSREGSSDAARAISRVSNDEFTVLLTAISSMDDVSLVAERLLKTLQKPIEVNNLEIFVDTAIGISIYKEDGTQAEELIQKASYVADLAQKEGKNSYKFYSAESNALLQERTNLQQSLRKALHTDEVYLVFQPKVSALDGSVIEAETLLRWNHPEKGLIPPNVFIPIAEQSGLIVDIGDLTLKRSCERAVQWRQEHGFTPTISVNVSGQQFNSENFYERVVRCLEETKVEPSDIVIELTESVAMRAVEKTISLLKDLRALGLRISVDDFGTGYSSLSYLKDFPIDEIKIDKSFVDGLPSDIGDRAICSAIVSMAKTLGLSIVAEGIETKAQAEYLRELGCDVFQGFFFSKPLVAKEFEAFVFGSYSQR